MIQKKDLADSILDKKRAGEFMFCPSCGGEYSASSGDYWNLPEDYVFKCGECKNEMQLATKSTVYNIIK
jgi:hypothetical protein